MKNWYLLKAKPKQESLAFEHLTKQNYTAYCPKAKINQKILHLFPGYLFVQLSKTTDNWLPIRSTRGVANFVRFGMEFARVPDSIIHTIKARESKTLDKIINLSKFHRGDKLRITQGMLQNQEAIFSHYEGDKRVVVLLNMIGRAQKIDLHSNQIEAV